MVIDKLARASGMVLLIGILMLISVLIIGEYSNNKNRNRLKAGDFTEIYINGIKEDREIVDRIYIDDFVVQFRGDNAFATYKGIGK